MNSASSLKFVGFWKFLRPINRVLKEVIEQEISGNLTSEVEKCIIAAFRSLSLSGRSSGKIISLHINQLSLMQFYHQERNTAARRNETTRKMHTASHSMFMFSILSSYARAREQFSATVRRKVVIEYHLFDFDFLNSDKLNEICLLVEMDKNIGGNHN